MRRARRFVVPVGMTVAPSETSLFLKNTREAKMDANMQNNKSARKSVSAAAKKVAEVMHEFKHGTLRSGRSKKIVTNPKQAIAIGLSEAHSEGAIVPSAPVSSVRRRS